MPSLVDQSLTGDGIAREMALASSGSQAASGIPPLDSLPFWRGQVRRLMANCGVTDPDNIDHYIANGGYEGLTRALKMAPEDVIEEVKNSGLWGRGGAAFSTGLKWEFLRNAKREPKYLICNADEGDPGAFVNRNLMESDPQLLVEGMIIAGFATDADRATSTSATSTRCRWSAWRRRSSRRREKGLLGKNILGSGFDFEVEVVRGAGSYVCGDETGLLELARGPAGDAEDQAAVPGAGGRLRACRRTSTTSSRTPTRR